MSRFSATQGKTTTPETAEEILFKPDRPRHIDRFINFFGGADAAPTSDPSGEPFMRTLDEDNE